MDDYESYEPAYLQKVKDQAARLNIAIDAGMGCICASSNGIHQERPPAREQHARRLRVAKAVGATSMRCYMGASEDRLGTRAASKRYMENTIKALPLGARGGAGPGRAGSRSRITPATCRRAR